MRFDKPQGVSIAFIDYECRSLFRGGVNQLIKMHLFIISIYN